MSLRRRKLTEEPRESDADFQARLAKMAAQGSANKQEEEDKVIYLPAKKATDRFCRIEQMYGCEFPVCASNRKMISAGFLEVTSGAVTRRLVAGRNSSLPAPEHYPIWIFALDRWRDAAIGHDQDRPPWIEIHLEHWRTVLQTKEQSSDETGGNFYKSLDSALRRFSQLQVHNVVLHPGGEREEQFLNTLCNYKSWTHKKRGLKTGFLQPGQEVWDQIRSRHLKQIDFEQMKVLTYTAQRLYVYLAKHFNDRVGPWIVGFDKLLPKIPLAMPFTKSTRQTLREAHGQLMEIGFLDDWPQVDADRTQIVYFIKPKQKQLLFA